MLGVSKAFVFCSWLQYIFATTLTTQLGGDRCTSIAVGKHATADGSTITTHNNDCQECDYRVTHVPARDWPVGSMRPIYDIRSMYPRYVQNSSENNYGPDYLQSSSYPDTFIYNWTVSAPMGYIPQVSHTFAYTLGLYGIQNEKQVTIGESTTGAKLLSFPISKGGSALMKLESLTELAMERCATARCAIRLMGELGEQYGFYGTDGVLEQAGEALTVADPNEVWVFHILPDDTGKSAVWVAQRVPDEHITVLANMFIIDEVDLSQDNKFMGSSNMKDVAVRAGLWSPHDDTPFSFRKVFGQDKGHLAYYGTRRIWRVFTLAAPSLASIFSPYTDSFATFGFGSDLAGPYPFSVQPDNLLTVQDIMRMNRDQYEGSEFDLTSGIDAGPFGDSMRYPAISETLDSVNGVGVEEYWTQGRVFERAISVQRTSYSTVAVARSWLPDIIGAVTWVAQYGPHHASFLPVYASAPTVPTTLLQGTPYRLDKRSNYWIHCLVSNYVSKWYSYTIGDVRNFQLGIDSHLIAQQQEAEKLAFEVIAQHPDPSQSPAAPDTNKPQSQASDATASAIHELDVRLFRDIDGTAIAILHEFQELAAVTTLEKWWDFFFEMAGRYRDLHHIVNIHAPDFHNASHFIGVPRWWLEQIGFWGEPGSPSPLKTDPIPIQPFSVPSLSSDAQYAAAYPQGPIAPYPWHSNEDYIALQQTNAELRLMLANNHIWTQVVIFIVGGVCGALLVTFFGRKRNVIMGRRDNAGYEMIP